MRLTKKDLQARRLFNPYDIAKAGPEPRVFIDYSPQDLGRAARSAKWQICGVGFQTDPEAHWQDYGNKTFPCWSPMKEKLSQGVAARKWAGEKYGVEEWERSPYGSYHPLGTMAEAIRKVRVDQVVPATPAAGPI